MTGPAINGQQGTVIGTQQQPAGGGTGGQQGTGSFVVGAPAGGQQPPGQQGAGGQGGDWEGPGSQRAVIADQFQRQVHKYGAERFAEMLYTENFELRDSQRNLQGQLRARPELPQGAVVLVGEDAKRHQALQQILTEHGNLTPDQVKERMARLTSLETAQAQAQLGTQAQQAAAPFRWNHEVLSDLLATKGLEIELRDTVVVQPDKTEKTVKLGYLRPKGQPNATWQRADEYAAQHLKPYLPALTAQPQGGTAGAGTSGTAGGQGAPAGGVAGAAGAPAAPAGAQGVHAGVVVFDGQQVPAGANGGQGAALDPVAAMIAANHQAAAGSNPLRPQAAPAGAQR